MAKGKQTPRQKMINLMYLVFIAMMALNIDVEIIRSYYDSTRALNETRFLTEQKNEDIFEKTLEAKAQQVPDTYATPWEQYKTLKSKIDVLVSSAEDIKVTLKKQSDFHDKDPKTGKDMDVSENFSALNNNEATTEYFFKDGDENSPSPKALELKKKLDDVRSYIVATFGGNAQLLKLVERANRSIIADYPAGKSPNGKTWFQNKFYHQPLIAAISNLEIIQNDARNVQSDALALMLQEKVDASIKFTSYEAIVSAPTDVQAGKKAEAVVMLGNYSNSSKISISGVSRQENGKGYLPLNTGGLGEKKIGGVITLTDATGKAQQFPFTHTYNVIAGPQQVKLEQGLLLSADKMNVMYRGLENPVTGSILGADNAKLSLSAPGAVVKNTGKGKWNVVPSTGNIVKLTLSGTDPTGKTVSQVFEYRIKGVPRPQGQIRGKAVNFMPVGSIPNQIVAAALPDFDFPVSFTVNSFILKLPGRAGTMIQGNSLSSAEGLIRNLRPGDVVQIYDIQATATGLGNQRLKEISPVIINVQ
ncbi:MULTISPECIES: type IX secretion system motor protein PorM/GldM [Chryseobacterium]|jgi:gliding motility-associated protein GldM|uniref:Gliding motility-associated protein GldM n=1 Tax=Chryseobacterium indoltheticum TaxID=254 RepID=A0A381F997_9FLAO|nr:MULTISPECIES: GldM family protein [Chryseobacterium]AZA73271.1 gliding motility protein GldM [Chryseobacterium indoltheticum]MDF2831212.1 gliding motility protein GldM [Chryseobacterium indoltheticum]MDQ8142696.1 GldM family protein [Chryseobacterium sp. CFS15]QQQ30148.1 gliding motility protein GldM [Chryseobacterium indoltheticum]SIR27655.1 gliding motility-associated protein GldM [Chryseobacterium indoltheticum]